MRLTDSIWAGTSLGQDIGTDGSIAGIVAQIGTEGTGRIIEITAIGTEVTGRVTAQTGTEGMADSGSIKAGIVPIGIGAGEMISKSSPYKCYGRNNQA